MPDQIPDCARDLEGTSRHVKLLLRKQFLDRIPFLRARQPPNAVADLFEKLGISQNLNGLLPAVVFVLAHDDRNGLAIPSDGNGLIPALDDINELAELRLHL